MSGLPTSPADRATQPSIDVRHEVDLAPLTTFGVRAIARVVYSLVDSARVDAVLERLQADESGAAAPRGRAPLVLGGGSNLLLARDLTEPVLQVGLKGRRLIADDGETVELWVGAGEIWHDTVRWTLAQGWYGLENLALIPGLVGGAPWQNIGAYGVEVGERIAAVEAVHLQDGRRITWSAADCAFGYRSSRFKTDEGRPWLITGVRLRLSRRPELRVNYGELSAALPAGAGPREVADAVEAIRRRKLPDPALLGNAGSFFKNPVVPATLADTLKQQHSTLPIYPAVDDGMAKLSAGWLIEAAGWKGRRQGDAAVSDRHALVLVNHGSATGAQIIALADQIRTSVADRFGVMLEPEPVILR